MTFLGLLATSLRLIFLTCTPLTENSNEEMASIQASDAVCSVSPVEGETYQLVSTVGQTRKNPKLKMIHPSLLKGDKNLNLVVMYTGTWCAPCRLMYQTVEDLRKQGYIVYLIDVDDHPTFAEKNKIAAVPTFVFFDKGRETIRLVGLTNISEFKKHLKTRSKQRSIRSILRSLY